MKSPLVSECMVYSKNDREITAVIVPSLDEIKNKSKSEEITDEQIELYVSAVIKTVNRKLPPYKRIKSFEISEKEFEKTSTRKIKRHRHIRSNGD